jgi:hypothetical protein
MENAAGYHSGQVAPYNDALFDEFEWTDRILDVGSFFFVSSCFVLISQIGRRK